MTSRKPRCQSVVYLQQGTQRIRLQCSIMGAEHTKHMAPYGGLMKSWTTEDAQALGPTTEDLLSHVPTTSSPIRAWKAWDLIEYLNPHGNIALGSVTTANPWTQKIFKVMSKLQEEGKQEDPNIPLIDWDWKPARHIRRGYAPGIHSYKCPLSLTKEYTGRVVGSCDLYGHVVEHEWGYRSQELEIMELWVPESVSIPLSFPGFPSVVLKKIETELSDLLEVPVNVLPKKQFEHWARYFCMEHCEDSCPQRRER